MCHCVPGERAYAEQSCKTLSMARKEVDPTAWCSHFKHEKFLPCHFPESAGQSIVRKRLLQDQLDGCCLINRLSGSRNGCRSLSSHLIISADGECGAISQSLCARRGASCTGSTALCERTRQTWSSVFSLPSLKERSAKQSFCERILILLRQLAAAAGARTTTHRMEEKERNGHVL
jgi:hypothetical protein